MYQSVLRLKDGTEMTGGSPGSAVKSLTLHIAVNAGQEFTIGSAFSVHWKRNPTTCRLCLGGTFLSVKRLNYRQR